MWSIYLIHLKKLSLCSLIQYIMNIYQNINFSKACQRNRGGTKKVNLHIICCRSGDVLLQIIILNFSHIGNVWECYIEHCHYMVFVPSFIVLSSPLKHESLGIS